MQLAYTCQNGRRLCEPRRCFSFINTWLIPVIPFAFCPIKDQTSPVNKKSMGSTCEQHGVAL